MENKSLLFARNGLKWSVLWLANFLRQSYIWENSHFRDLFTKALDQSDCSILQVTISLEQFNRFLYFFCIKIEYHLRRLGWWCHFSREIHVCPKKGQKWAGQLEKMNFFIYCSKLSPSRFSRAYVEVFKDARASFSYVIVTPIKVMLFPLMNVMSGLKSLTDQPRPFTLN